jgi:hypothetical protein
MIFGEGKSDYILYKGIYFDPYLVGDDILFSEFQSDPEGCGSGYNNLSVVLYMLFKERLLEVYWTDDDMFYLENNADD